MFCDSQVHNNVGFHCIDPSILMLFHSVKPTLKKVSKYENKFAKLQKKAAEFNFRNQLKQVKKKEFTMEEDEKKDKEGKEKPEWSKGKEKTEVEA
jgi:hypothetical protein